MRPIGFYLLLFIFIMDSLTEMYLLQLPKFNLLNPTVKAQETITSNIQQKNQTADIENYIESIFKTKIAIEVQHHECNPKNPSYPRCIKNDAIEYSCGIFQINLRYHENYVKGKTLDEKCLNLLDPYYNTLVAFKIYSDSKNFCPWTWYRKNYCERT